MVVTNSRKRRRFTVKQRAAQKLFAKRARSGAFRRNTKLTGKRPARKVSRSFRAHFGAPTPSLWKRPRRSKRKNSGGWRFSRSTEAKLSKSHFVGAKLKRRRNRSRTTMARHRNPFGKRTARRAARKFWRSAKGRKWKAARRAGHSIRAAWRIAKGAGGGTTVKRKRRRSTIKRRKHITRRRAHRKSIKRVRAGRVGAARRKARRSGYGGPMFLNPRKRRKSRRRSRRRSHTTYRRRRNLYVVSNARRRGRRRSRRRNTGYGIFSNPRRLFGSLFRRHRRGRRRNPGLGTLMTGAKALAGFAIVRSLPGLVARFAPGVLASIVGIAGTWADVAVSAGALYLLGFISRWVPFLNDSAVVTGAAVSLALDVAQRVVPPNLLMMAGIPPAAGALPGGSMSGWFPADRTGAIGAYVSSPMAGYVSTPPLGVYVEEAGMGAEARQVLMGLGVDVTSSSNCPGCTALPAQRLSLPARMASAGIPGYATRDIGPMQAIAVPGIFNGSIFNR
jgi:hypothetical protein